MLPAGQLEIEQREPGLVEITIRWTPPSEDRTPVPHRGGGEDMTRRRDLHRRATRAYSRCRSQRGVTLIELMVGMLIGLLAVLVISQVLLTTEGQKRTTTSGADAQVTGSLAMYTLQRELQMAGYGLATSQLGLGCSIRSLRYTAGNGNGTANRILAPAVITDGASGAPDQLRIYAASKNSFSVPTRVTSNHPTSGAGSTEFVLNNMVGIATGDLMIAVPKTPSATDTCTVFRATGVGGTPDRSILHATGDTGGWNTNLMTAVPGRRLSERQLCGEPGCRPGRSHLQGRERQPATGRIRQRHCSAQQHRAVSAGGQPAGLLRQGECDQQWPGRRLRHRHARQRRPSGRAW